MTEPKKLFVCDEGYAGNWREATRQELISAALATGEVVKAEPTDCTKCTYWKDGECTHWSHDLEGLNGPSIENDNEICLDFTSKRKPKVSKISLHRSETTAASGRGRA